MFNIIYTTCLSLPPLMKLEDVYHSIFPNSNWVDTSQAVKAKDTIPDIFEKINHLRDDILFYFHPTKNATANAYGNQSGPTSFVVVDKELANTLDLATRNHTYKHEIAHIYYNDHFNNYFRATFAAAITAYVLYQLQFILPWWMSVLLLCLPYLIYKKTFPDLAFQCILEYNQSICEKRADDFAIQHSTDDELQGGKRYYQAIEEAKQDILKASKILPSIHVDFDGFDPHLTNMERVQIIENEMYQRGMDVEELDNDSNNLVAKQTIKAFYIKHFLGQIVAKIPSESSTILDNQVQIIENQIKIDLLLATL